MDLNKINLTDLITETTPFANDTIFEQKTDNSCIDNIKQGLYDFKKRCENNMLMIIDGSSILTTAYYADISPRITSEGLNTNAIVGAMRSLSNIIYFQKPTHMVVTLDRTRMTFRTLLYEKYKSNRKPSPPDLKEQFILFEEVLKNIGIPVLVTEQDAPIEETYEADDYSATLVKMFNKDIPIIVTSKDSDYLQLAGDSLVYLITKNSRELAQSIDLDLLDLNVPPNSFPYNTDTLKYLKDMTPEQVVQYKALVGDTSDCIPGVPGCGVKSGPLILKAYQNIDLLYNTIEDLTEDELNELSSKWEQDYGIKSAKNLIKKLLNGKEMAYVSEKLGRMKDDIPLDITLEDIKLDISKEKWNKEMDRLEMSFFNMK